MRDSGSAWTVLEGSEDLPRESPGALSLRAVVCAVLGEALATPAGGGGPARAWIFPVVGAAPPVRVPAGSRWAVMSALLL